MAKEWTVEAALHILTSVHGDSEKEARTIAKRELHELASNIRPLCDCLDIELKNLDCEEGDD